jgi:hypothetical protein
MRRRRIFWFLSNFLEEVEVLTWLKHHSIMNSWIAKRHPSLNAVKQADEDSVKAMVDRVKNGDSRNFELAVSHIATDDRMQGFFYDSLIAHGHMAGNPTQGDSAIADLGPQRDAQPVMNQFGHIVNPESGWQPAWMPPGANAAGDGFYKPAKGGGKTKGIGGGTPTQQPWFQIAGGGVPKPAGQGTSRGAKQRRVQAQRAANVNNQHQIVAHLKPPRFTPPPGLDAVDPGKGGKGGGGKGGKKGKKGKNGKNGGKNGNKQQALPNAPGGNPNGKGGNPNNHQAKLLDWEKAWFDGLTSWGDPRRCVFWNATCGCPFGTSCKFTHNVCLICGMGHKAVDHHWKDEPVTQ